jgi:hypothetical protein
MDTAHVSGSYSYEIKKKASTGDLLDAELVFRSRFIFVVIRDTVYGTNCSAEKTSPERSPMLKGTRKNAIFKR